MRKKDWKRARKRTGSGRPACLPASTRQIKGELLKRTRNHSATLAFIVVSVDNRAFRLVDRHKGVAVRLAGCPDPYLDRNRGTRERERRKNSVGSYSQSSEAFLFFPSSPVRKPRGFDRLENPRHVSSPSLSSSTLNEKFIFKVPFLRIVISITRDR